MIHEMPLGQQRERIPNDPEIWRERLFAQNETLLNGARRLAEAVERMPCKPGAEPPRALIVGGFVRDALLGLHPKDLDIEVYGLTVDELIGAIERTFSRKVELIGSSFGVFKVALEKGFDLDISLPRTESRADSDVQIVSDPFLSVAEAARRRDFTMNTLAADPLTGEIIDHFGAIADLNARVLRATDRERFQDDALRVYRAVQFCARMNMHPDAETMNLLSEMVKRGDLERLSPEQRLERWLRLIQETIPEPDATTIDRIRALAEEVGRRELSVERRLEQWKKLLLKAERPSIGLNLMRELGIIERLYPELNALIGTPQDPEWHPEGDVWTHTLMVVDAAARIVRREQAHLSKDEAFAVVMGALCHDFGKPGTTRFEGGRIRSRGHEEAGAEPAKAFLERLRAPGCIVEAATRIAAEHLKPGVLSRAYEDGTLDRRQYANNIRRLLKRLGGVSWRVLLAASEADARGRTIPGAATAPYIPGERFAEAVEEYALDREGREKLVQGRDLLSLGMKPGTEVGTLINKIEQLRDEGILETRLEALRYARIWLGLEVPLAATAERAIVE